jgi:prevent-host-death family protein
MTKNQVISINELKTNTSEYINLLSKTGDKYIFVHSKPKAVLIDIDKYEKIKKLLDDKNIINTLNDI